MPQNDMNFEGGRRATRRNTYKATHLVVGQGPDTRLVNGAFVHNGFSVDASGTSESTSASTLCHTKPLCMVNGYTNHGFKGKTIKAASARIHRKQGSTISTVDVAAAANRVSSAGGPGGTSVTYVDAVAVPQKCGQMEPEPSLSTARKNQRRRKGFIHRKRDNEVTCLKSSALPLMPPQEKEDWENEIQEVTTTDSEKMRSGLRPYGPEDVLLSDLRDLTLRQRDEVDLLVTTSYSPSLHHPRPIRWFCYNIPTEPDQFADADE